MKSLSHEVPYASHSFDQQVVSTSDGGFLFADRGDASPRGFGLTKLSASGNLTLTFTPFHFRKINPYQATGSELAGIAETSYGYVLAGDSDRVLSTTAIDGNKLRTRDMFVQIISKDFYKQQNDKDKVVSIGESRKDEKTEDTGIIWLTNYSNDERAAYPQFFRTEKGFILVWEREVDFSKINAWDYADTWYMVLNEDGSVAKAATRMENAPDLRLMYGEIWYSNGNLQWVQDSMYGYDDAFKGAKENDMVIYTLQINAKYNDSYTHTAAVKSEATPTTTTPTVPEAQKSSTPVADTVTMGGIEWRVLKVDGKKALVISEYVLVHKPFHSEEKAITWQTSDLCKYLNGEFYDATFSSEEKKRVQNTDIHGSANKLFLLTKDEVREYLSGNIPALGVSTGEKEVWWLMPSDVTFSKIVFATSSGSINEIGTGLTIARGVRPAMWIDSE